MDTLGKSRRRVVYVLLGLAIAWEAGAASDEPLVLIQRVVDTRYGETPAATAHFDALVRSPIQRLVEVREGDSLQGMASRLYGIGPSATPDQYNTLVEGIAAKNDLSDPSRIVAGTKLKFPDLPEKLYKKPDPGNPNYGQPRISPGPALNAVKGGVAFNFKESAFTATPTISDAARKASPKVLQWRWVPASVAKQEIQTSGDQVKVLALSGPMTVRYVDLPCACAPPSISGDVDFVRTLLGRRQPKHKSILFVLDDSWPSDAEFARTRDFMISAVAAVRGRFQLGSAGWLNGFNGAATTTFPFLSDGRRSHTAGIVSSLSPFAQLTPNVQVIYLPMSREQKWAGEIWHEILFVTQTARAMQDALDQNVPASPDAVKAGRSSADELLTQIPSAMTGDVGATDQVTVNALAKFAHLYSRAAGTPFFLSMSWYVVSNTVEFALDEDSLGVPLAAVGNESNQEIIGIKRLLSYRAKASPGDVVAVMNPNRDGKLTCSSYWSLPAGEAFYGLAYDGSIEGGGCGTSYSTPRVGWMLALREGYNDPVTDAMSPYWYGHYRTFVDGMKDANASGYLKYWLSPQKLFAGL